MFEWNRQIGVDILGPHFRFLGILSTAAVNTVHSMKRQDAQ